MAISFSKIEASHAEWEKWQEIVKELRRLRIEINNQNKLNDLIKEWGELYHDLKIAINHD